MCSASQQDGQSYRSQMPESLHRRRAQRMGEASWERTGFTNARTIWKQAVGGAGKRRGKRSEIQECRWCMVWCVPLEPSLQRQRGWWELRLSESGWGPKAGMLVHELYHTWLKVSATGAKMRALQPWTQGLRSNWSLNDEMEMNAL